MPQGVWVYLGLFGLIQLMLRGHAATVGVMVLVLVLGLVEVWLIAKAWRSVQP